MTASGRSRGPSRGRRTRRVRGSRRGTPGRRRRPGRAGDRRSRRRGPDGGRMVRRLESSEDAGRVDGRQAEADRCLARAGDHRRRREVAQAEARRAQPADPAVASRLARRPDRPPEVVADPLRAGDPARDVVADVGDDRRPRLRRVQGVERGDAVGLGRRHGQPSRDVVQGRLADPADPILHGVEGRQQLRAAGPDRVAATGRCPVDARATRTRRPSRTPAARGRASTAARSAGDASGPMTCRSIAAECSAGSAAEVARVA